MNSFFDSTGPSPCTKVMGDFVHVDESHSSSLHCVEHPDRHHAYRIKTVPSSVVPFPRCTADIFCDGIILRLHKVSTDDRAKQYRNSTFWRGFHSHTDEEFHQKYYPDRWTGRVCFHHYGRTDKDRISFQSLENTFSQRPSIKF